MRNRLSVPDSRREYHIDSSQDLRQEYIEENGSSDYRVYRTGPRSPRVWLSVELYGHDYWDMGIPYTGQWPGV